MNKFALLIVALGGAILRVYVAVQMWAWFVAPVTGWSTPTIWHMAGLFMMKGIFCRSNSDEDEPLNTPGWAAVLGAIIATLLTWGIGALLV